MRTLFRYGSFLTLALVGVGFATAARARFGLDVSITKAKDGPEYLLIFRNNAFAIPSGYHLISIDAVPAGVTINSIVAPGWICAPLPPVVGPRTLTCTYNVFLPVPSNTYLPTIHLGFTNAGNKQNCTNVRITDLNNVGVPESNVLNNKSCK